MLSRDDITPFTRYRNDAEIARYQDWTVPYTRDLAHEMVDELERLGRPTPGEWVQLALDRDGTLVGDVAVWLDADAELGMIGYTLAPEHHGHGYASEAVGEVVRWLFKRQGVHRVAATIDPRNLASARVLERCGFEYVGTARSSAWSRGEWTDDARFSLLRDDWEAWRSRPRGRPRSVELVEVTSDNVLAVSDLSVGFSQRGLVAPVPVSLAQALRPPTVRGQLVEPWLRAIEADGVLAGFVMLAEPYPGSPHPYLWRLLVDHAHQRRGIGRTAVVEIARRRRAAGATHLAVDYVPGVTGNAEAFYRGLGFVPTGETNGDEVRAVLDLSTIEGD